MLLCSCSNVRVRVNRLIMHTYLLMDSAIFFALGDITAQHL